ncbi:MAG: polymer-forming cytoskeletal protein [Pseudomonadota bacterium]
MTPSILGSDLKLMGNAHSEGEVHVAGEVQGDIQCASLLVEETATITGGVMAEDVIVRGKVMGSIRGMRVTLQSSSHVEGDVFHQSLAIEQGAFFEGKSRRQENPIADAPKMDGAPQASASNGSGLSTGTSTTAPLPTGPAGA